MSFCTAEFIPTAYGRNGKKSLTSEQQARTLQWAKLQLGDSKVAYRKFNQPFDKPSFVAAVCAAFVPDMVDKSTRRATSAPLVSLQQLAFISFKVIRGFSFCDEGE